MSMFKGCGLVVVVLTVAGAGKVGLCGSFCEGWAGRPDFEMYGLCFSPYPDPNRPPQDVPINLIIEKLEIVAPYTEWVRSFSATSNLQEIPEQAKKLGLKVAMGAWIRPEEVRDEEIDNLIAKAEAGYVDVAVVGNEELWWGEHGKADAIDPCELVLALETVRQRLDDANLPHIPVTTADPWDALFKRDGASFKYQEVLDAVDVFYVNIYPFHEHAHISRAIEKLEETYSAVLKDANEAGPGKEVIIGETGWPSDEEHWGPAKPSLANAARYFNEAQCWAAHNNVKMFWFSAIDEKWKAEPEWPGGDDPPDYEAHWGIWDSEGVLKESFLPEYVFCEDFDPNVIPFCAYTWDGTSVPGIVVGDSNSEGDFLRILYYGEISPLNRVTFNKVAEGPFSHIVAEFDFRMFGDGDNGDGFSFLLMPTSEAGTSGCPDYGGSLKDVAEQPALAKTFAVGFEICDGGVCDWLSTANRIYISWDEQWYPEGIPIDIDEEDVGLDSGSFHRAHIEVCYSDGDTGLVSVLITPDIYDANHPATVTVAENVIIGGGNHPYRPYENRVEFAGRNGGESTNADIDNIYVSYRTEFCGYFLEGDVNGDCRINLFDLASLANNWLVNCNSSPVNEECMPE